MTDLTAAIDAARLDALLAARTEYERQGYPQQELDDRVLYAYERALTPHLHRAWAERAAKAIEAQCRQCEVDAECEYADAARLVREMGAEQ